jgi:cyclopropane fatty-acyl-phospholipid synthase-like methyltransferase
MLLFPRKLLKKIINNTILRYIFVKYLYKFNNSSIYWENRYNKNGNSGSGSYGRLSEFKADEINKFVTEKRIKNIIEFGCGDGNQLLLAKYENYLGLDISETAINLCRDKFKNDHNKRFEIFQFYVDQKKFDLALSLDVIYHLVEDEIYDNYMRRLFSSSNKYVIIYSSNFSDKDCSVPHVVHRKFTDWVKINVSDFVLETTIQNKYPYRTEDQDNTSLADFYIYKKL